CVSPVGLCARDGGAGILASGKLLEPLAGLPELGPDRGARQRGQLPHVGKPEEREASARSRVGGKQVEGKRREGSGSALGRDGEEGRRRVLLRGTRQARGKDR